MLQTDTTTSRSQHQKLQEEEGIMTFILLSGAARHPGHGTRNAREGEFPLSGISSIWCHKISWSQHQKLQEESLHKFMLMFMFVS